MPAIQVGAVVEWESQSGGYRKVKRGTVVAYLPPGEDARSVLSRLGLVGPLKAQPISRVPRYLVEVQAGPKARHYYAPLADRLEFWGRVEGEP